VLCRRGGGKGGKRWLCRFLLCLGCRGKEGVLFALDDFKKIRSRIAGEGGNLFLALPGSTRGGKEGKRTGKSFTLGNRAGGGGGTNSVRALVGGEKEKGRERRNVEVPRERKEEKGGVIDVCLRLGHETRKGEDGKEGGCRCVLMISGMARGRKRKREEGREKKAGRWYLPPILGRSFLSVRRRALGTKREEGEVFR